MEVQCCDDAALPDVELRCWSLPVLHQCRQTVFESELFAASPAGISVLSISFRAESGAGIVCGSGTSSLSATFSLFILRIDLF